MEGGVKNSDMEDADDTGMDRRGDFGGIAGTSWTCGMSRTSGIGSEDELDIGIGSMARRGGVVEEERGTGVGSMTRSGGIIGEVNVSVTMRGRGRLVDCLRGRSGTWGSWIGENMETSEGLRSG